MKMTLLEIRKEKKIKQRTIIEHMGVDRKTVYRWENQITAPDHWQLLKLCQYYGVNPEQVQISYRRDPYSFLPWSKTEEEYKADCEKFRRDTAAWYEENVSKPFEEMRKSWNIEEKVRIMFPTREKPQ